MGKHTKERMATHSFRLPEKLRARMRGHDTVNWSNIVRDLLTKKLDELDAGLWQPTSGTNDES